MIFANPIQGTLGGGLKCGSNWISTDACLSLVDLDAQIGFTSVFLVNQTMRKGAYVVQQPMEIGW